MEQYPDLNALLAFVKVAESRSFSAAARELKMQKSTISRLVSTLESQANRQLLYRTTRQVEPTNHGKELLSRCAQSKLAAELAR